MQARLAPLIIPGCPVTSPPPPQPVTHMVLSGGSGAWRERRNGDLGRLALGRCSNGRVMDDGSNLPVTLDLIVNVPYDVIAVDDNCSESACFQFVEISPREKGASR